MVGALVCSQLPGILGHKLALVTRPGYAQVPGLLVRCQIVLVRAGVVAHIAVKRFTLERKFMSCGHCQEMGQLANLASDWLFTLVQPIRSQLDC